MDVLIEDMMFAFKQTADAVDELMAATTAVEPVVPSVAKRLQATVDKHKLA